MTPVSPSLCSPYAWSVGAANVLVTHEARNTWSAVEAAISIDAHRVLDTAAVVHLALVDIVADLALPGGVVQADPSEPVAAGVALGKIA